MRICNRVTKVPFLVVGIGVWRKQARSANAIIIFKYSLPNVAPRRAYGRAELIFMLNHIHDGLISQDTLLNMYSLQYIAEENI